jgi:hypothetical protein
MASIGDGFWLMKRPPLGNARSAPTCCVKQGWCVGKEECHAPSIFWFGLRGYSHCYVHIIVVFSSPFQEGCPLCCYAIYNTKVSLCYEWMLLCYQHGTKAPMAFSDLTGISD